MAQWKQFIAPIALVWLCPTAGYATQYLTVEEAQKIAFPSADVFQEAHVVFTEEQLNAIENATEQKVLAKGQQIWKVFSKDSYLGLFVVDYVIGKHLVIDYAVALEPDGSIKQVDIMQYRESYGGEIRNPEWTEQFKGKTKDSSLELNVDITNIGGATLSSRHVTEGVKRVLATVAITQK